MDWGLAIVIPLKLANTKMSKIILEVMIKIKRLIITRKKLDYLYKKIFRGDQA